MLIAHVEASALAAALKQGVARPGSPMPIIGMALLNATAEGLSITTTDLEVRVRMHVDAEIEKPGTLAVDDALLRSAAHGAGPVTLTQGEAQMIAARGKRSRVKIGSLPADQFPSPDEAAKWVDLTIDPEALAIAIDTVSYAVAAKGFRPWASCVIVRPGHVAASDGVRGAVASLDYDGPELMISARAWEAAKRLMTRGAVISAGYYKTPAANDRPNMVRVRDGRNWIVITTVRHAAPDFKAVVQDAGRVPSIKLKRAALRDAVARISPFCAARLSAADASKVITDTRSARLRIAEGDACIESLMGDNTEDVTDLIDGDVPVALDDGIRLEHLSGALNALKCDTVLLSYLERPAPMWLVQPASGPESHHVLAKVKP